MYMSSDRKYLSRQPCFQEHIFEQFKTVFLENVSITFNGKTEPLDGSIGIRTATT